jgi:hypothetical protein
MLDLQPLTEHLERLNRDAAALYGEARHELELSDVHRERARVRIEDANRLLDEACRVQEQMAALRQGVLHA